MFWQIKCLVKIFNETHDSRRFGKTCFFMEENTELIFHFNIGAKLLKALLDSPLFGAGDKHLPQTFLSVIAINV